MDGEDHGLGDVQIEGSEQLDAELRRFCLQPAPGAVEAVGVRILGVDLQSVDVGQGRRIHRIGPAEMGVMAVQHERRSGEEASGHMPPLPALQHRLVPGHRARIGLMRIDEQPRRAVGGT